MLNDPPIIIPGRRFLKQVIHLIEDKMWNATEKLKKILSDLQEIRHDLECIADEEGIEDLVYAAGNISDAIAEVEKALNVTPS